MESGMVSVEIDDHGSPIMKDLDKYPCSAGEHKMVTANWTIQLAVKGEQMEIISFVLITCKLLPRF
jgi:hypothetical protein